MRVNAFLFFLLLPFLGNAQYKHLEKGDLKVYSKEAHDGLLRAKDKSLSLFGFIDTLGQTVIPFKYKHAFDFSESMAIVVTTENKYIYLNTEGTHFDKGQYQDLGDFRNGFAIVQEDFYGVIDKNEDYLIEPQYDKILSKNNYYFWVKKDGYYGIVNRDNKIIFDIEYDMINSNADSLFFLKKGDFWAMGNTEGEIISEFKYTKVKPAINANHSSLRLEDGTEIYVDLHGELIDQYSFIGNLKDGLIYVEKDGLKGFLDKDYNVVIPVKYQSAIQQDGLVSAKDSTYYGLINNRGKVIMPFKYEAINLIKPNLLFVTEKEESRLFYRNGKLFSDLVFDKTFFSGLYRFNRGYMVAVKEAKHGLIDTSGSLVIPFEFDALKIGFHELIFAKKDEKWGAINYKGDQVIPFEFDLILNEGVDYIKTIKNNKFGLYKGADKLFDPMYDNMYEFKEKHIIVRNNERYGLISDRNDIVLEIKYEDMNAPTFGNGVVFVENGLQGYYSFEEKKIILDPLYDSIKSYYSDKAIILEKDSKKALYNKQKGFILDFEYDEIITRGIGVEVNKNGKIGFLSKTGVSILDSIYDEIKFSSATSANVRIGEQWEFIEWEYPEN